ncbi:hypothetical protein DMENIID0001_130190 [Sergentomyia squamirostris]
MANSSNIFYQIVNSEEIVVNPIKLPMFCNNQQFILHQYDVRSLLDARISALEPYTTSYNTFAPHLASTLNQSQIMDQTYGETMQCNEDLGGNYQFHFDQSTSTHDSYINAPTSYQNAGVNTYNSTKTRGTCPPFLEESLKKVKELNAQQMIKKRKENQNIFF